MSDIYGSLLGLRAAVDGAQAWNPPGSTGVLLRKKPPGEWDPAVSETKKKERKGSGLHGGGEFCGGLTGVRWDWAENGGLSPSANFLLSFYFGFFLKVNSSKS